MFLLFFKLGCFQQPEQLPFFPYMARIFFTLAKLMRHEGISVLQRYLKQTNLDTEEAHRRAGPVDICVDVVKSPL